MNNGGLDSVSITGITIAVTTLCKAITASFDLSNAQKFLMYLLVTCLVIGAWAVSNGPVTIEWTYGLVTTVILVMAAAGGFSIVADKVTGGKTTAKGDSFNP